MKHVKGIEVAGELKLPKRRLLVCLFKLFHFPRPTGITFWLFRIARRCVRIVYGGYVCACVCLCMHFALNESRTDVHKSPDQYPTGFPSLDDILAPSVGKIKVGVVGTRTSPRLIETVFHEFSPSAGFSFILISAFLSLSFSLFPDVFPRFSSNPMKFQFNCLRRLASDNKWRGLNWIIEFI